MLTSITITQIYVPDQDQALDFYVGKLGLEVDTDVDLGFMRWLTIRVPGDPDHKILLERPGAPAMSEETAAEVGMSVSGVRKRLRKLKATLGDLAFEGSERAEASEVRP